MKFVMRPENRQALLPRIAQHLAGLPPDQTWEILVREFKRRRSLDQNAHLHAILTDIAEQVEWYGRKWTVTVWKRLCTATWLREEGEQPMMVPALDGNGFDIVFEHTSRLSVAQMARLIEWCLAYGGEHGVRWSAPDREVMG